MFMSFSCSKTYASITHTSYLGLFFVQNCFYGCFIFKVIFLFGLKMFSVSNVLTPGAFHCSSVVIDLCEVSQSFSSNSFQYFY